MARITGHPYRSYNRERDLYRLMTKALPFTSRPTFTEWKAGVKRRRKPKAEARRKNFDIGSY